jgi:hypothetical protein
MSFFMAEPQIKRALEGARQAVFGKVGGSVLEKPRPGKA